MIVFSRKTIRIGEVYFAQQREADSPHVDLIRFLSVLAPQEEAQWTKGHTLLIALTNDTDTLLKEMESGTRYEIRRAQSKDVLTHVGLDSCSAQDVDAFCDYYDEFARSKSLRPIFRPRLHQLARERNLLLSSMSDADGHVLVQHAHLLMPERAMLLYSASKFREVNDSAARSLVGRANRLLHWNDMLAAKALGIPVYDLCGVDVTNKSPETTRIAQFKQGFGGQVVPSFSRTVARTIKGRVVNKLLNRLGMAF